MEIWGLTGNIACGKSAVEEMLRQAGIAVIDADQVARAVVEPGEPALAEIVAAFGSAVLREDGSLDRPAVAERIFGDPDARSQLETITHPRIHRQIAEQIADLAGGDRRVAVVSAALMVETGSWELYDGMAVVTCPEQTQLERLLARDELSRDEALARLRSQLPQDEKAALADVVIDNGGPLAKTAVQVQTWVDRLAAC